MRTSIFPRPDGGAHGAFTLLELLVTVVVVLLILAALADFTTSAELAWKKASADPFAEASEAFETMVNRLSVSTLESYQDYADTDGAFLTNATGSFTPDHLARRSDLAFACGASSGATGRLSGSNRVSATDGIFFLAPQGYTQSEAHVGLERLLNALGYFVEFSDESAAPTFMLSGTHRWRWRLKEVMQPSESLGIYTNGTSLSWVQTLVQQGAPISILAENVIALIVLPDRAASDAGASLAPAYNYDSRDAGNSLTRNQLPARLRIALVAINEASAATLAAQNGSQPPSLVPTGLFLDSSNMQSDLASLDSALAARGIQHRILQREIIFSTASWSETPSQ